MRMRVSSSWLTTQIDAGAGATPAGLSPTGMRRCSQAAVGIDARHERPSRGCSPKRSLRRWQEARPATDRDGLAHHVVHGGINGENGLIRLAGHPHDERSGRQPAGRMAHSDRRAHQAPGLEAPELDPPPPRSSPEPSSVSPSSASKMPIATTAARPANRTQGRAPAARLISDRRWSRRR